MFINDLEIFDSEGLTLWELLKKEIARLEVKKRDNGEGELTGTARRIRELSRLYKRLSIVMEEATRLKLQAEEVEKAGLIPYNEYKNS